MLKNKEQTSTLLILKSLGINYPILRELGADLGKIMLLVLQEGQTKAAVDFFSNIDVPTLCERMTWKQVSAILEEQNSTWVIYPYPHSRKGLDFLMSLATAVQVGEISGLKINALPLVISEGFPQGCDLTRFFTVYLEGALGNERLNWNMVVPPDEQIPVVLDKVKEYAERLVRYDEDNRDTGGLVEAFIKNLYCWQEKTGFSAAYELPALKVDLADKMEQIMLFDSRFIYLKGNLFKQIAGQLLNIFSLDVIKAKLSEAAVLCPEGGGATYTAKVGYYNTAGICQRERMLRLDRKRLNISGELEFVDLCLNAGGK